MTNYLSIIASIAIIIYIAKELYKAYYIYNEWREHRQQVKDLTNDHPELKGVDIENGLMAFIAPSSVRDMIINNEDDGDNVPMLSKGYSFYDEDDDEYDEEYE